MIRKPNFKLNWKYALGELVLIFLGISLAITFQNWNNQQQENDKRLVLLERIKSDLEEDKLNLQAVLERHLEYDSILNVVQLGAPNAAGGFGRLNATIAPRLNTTSFQAYTSSGNLEFLNNKLGISIQAYYLEYQEWGEIIDFFNSTIENELRYKFNEYAITEASVSRMQKSQNLEEVFDAMNVENIIKDVVLHRIIGSLRISSRICQKNYKQGIEEIDLLIIKIKEALDQ